ncbi:MAG: histidine kinase, partial [Longimicrobiaceae bacterium]
MAPPRDPRLPSPADPAAPPFRPVGWGAIAAFWLAAAVFLYSQRLLWAAMGISRMEVREVRVAAAVAYGVCMGLWALLTPGLLRLVERFHFQRGARLRSSLVHGALGTTLAVGMNAVGWDLARHLYNRPQLRLEVYLVNNLDTDLFLYLIVVGGASALRFHRDLRAQEVRAARLQARLAGERLEAVKMRLEPPFLYAALDSVAAAVRREPDRAELMVSSLGDVLRAKVASAGAELVPLRDELEFAAAYAALQRLRAGDAFRVELDAAPGAAGALVPPFVLQPLLDEAVRVACGAAGGGP